MELEVQKYLRSGKTLSDLKDENGIKSNEGSGLVILNYDQINSPKTDPMVMECRGLILEQGTWNVVSMAFRRFFNHGEATDITQNFDFASAHVLEKVDGSIIQVFQYKGDWMMATRGTIQGTGEVGFLNVTFRQLFDKIIDENYPKFWKEIEEGFCYIFELVSPESKVVKPYNRGLYLLGMRDVRDDWKELSYNTVKASSEWLGVMCPEAYPISGISEIINSVGKLETLDEGYVCVDYSKLDEHGQHPRLKVKNPAYVAIAHLKESSASSMRALMQLIMTGETDEFLGYFPDFKPSVDKIEERYKAYISGMRADAQSVSSMLEKERTPENRKNYALFVKNLTCPGFMFHLYEGKVDSVEGYYDLLMKDKGAKSTSKKMLSTLKIKDIDFQQDV
jgi:T4 RnlA family RNA ligase